VGLLARFFSGSLTIPDMMKMTWKEIKFWYDIYELQATEEEVIQELSYDSKGNKKTLPPPNVIRKKTLERIEQRRNKVDGGNQ
jgi:hypothetical protein